MKDHVDAALVQMSTEWLEPEQNRGKMLSYVESVCTEAPTDLIVFPELATTGYVVGRDADFNARFIEASEKIPGPTTEVLCEAARTHRVHIIFGMSEIHPKIPATLYNSAILINAHGRVEGVHHK
jgi:predicted amidohydrolase